MSDSDSEMDEFARNILERAKLRSQMLHSNLQKGTIALDETECHPIEPSTLPTVPEGCLKEIEMNSSQGFSDRGPSSPVKAKRVDNNENDHGTGAGGRRSRLKSLARRINEWEDDMTHHVLPTSRFNVSPPKQSRQSKNFSSPGGISINSPSKQSKLPATSAANSTPDFSNKGNSMRNSVVQPKTPSSSTTQPQLNSTLPVGLSVAQRAKLFEQKACGNVPLPKPLVPLTSRQFQRGQRHHELNYCTPSPPAPAPTSSTTARSASRSPKKETTKKETPTMGSQSTTPKRSAEARSRSSSPDKSYPGANSLKRIRVKEPKPGRIYPSLTDIEATETETEAEVDQEEANENVDDGTLCSGFSECSSLGTQIERVATTERNNENLYSVPDILPKPKNTPRRNHYRPTEDFSASLACHQIDACIDEALDGQDFSIDTINEGGLCKAVASSTPINSTFVEFMTDKSEAISSSGTLGEGNGETLSMEMECALDVSFRSDETVIAAEETSVILCCHSSCSHLDMNTPKQGASPLGASSPLCAKRCGGAASSPQTQTPLLHTVSFFRKQQDQMTPKRPLQLPEAPQHPPSPDRRQARVMAVNDAIKKLEDELNAQNRSIAQVSKALSLCKSTVEFSESTEKVECERILLIGTQKRLDILNEIHRLKTDGALTSLTTFSPSKNKLGPTCRGKLTISGLAVKLKRDFLTSALSGDTVYHFIALVKHHGYQVEGSSVVSVGPGVRSRSPTSHSSKYFIRFPNTFTLEDLEPEFEAKLEVYVLQTQREFLPHETKYHIKKCKESKGLTPKKSKVDSKLSRAFHPSPAGPDSVRTTNFSICGRLTIDISTLGRERDGWTLEGVRYTSPIEGSLSMQVACSAEGSDEKSGFLTLFHDVSGLGAWHRRWCKLTANHVAFWMYPEDEMNGKIPVDTIALRECVTTRVAPVDRDVCARANTFLMLTTRQPLESDKDSLIMSCHSDYTAIRHLMSADTREERDDWCVEMNRALTNLRAWDPPEQSPDDTLF